jgi:RNA methyltransferase, TrmH family
VITSPHNDTLRLVRRLRSKRQRARTGLFVAEGEDLASAAEAAGAEPHALLVSGVDVEPELLDDVSSLGSGTRVVGVWPQRWSALGEAALSVYLEGVSDPGNVGAVIRSAHALADGPVILGPRCADPYGPRAVRASMGSVFARPPARAAGVAELPGTAVGLDARLGEPLPRVRAEPPVVLCLGAEREGLSERSRAAVATLARIQLREGGPESLNVAAAAAIALYERTRMAEDA